MEKLIKIEEVYKKNKFFDVENFLLSFYGGMFDADDKMFSIILDLLKKRCIENGIEDNFDAHSAANAVLKTLVDKVNQDNKVNLSFSDIVNFETEYIDNINKTIDLADDKRMIQFDAITNVDWKKPMTSLTELYNRYIATKLQTLIEDVCVLYDDRINEKFENSFNPFGSTKIELSEETKRFYKNELEFFLLLPELSIISKTTVKYKEKVHKIRNDLLVDSEIKKFPEYINQLYDLVNHDQSNLTYYYHGADSLQNAEKIMNEGLFMQYGDINRTAKPELTIPEILDYSYGYERVGKNAIVVIGSPKYKGIIKRNTNNNIEVAGTGQGMKGIDGFIPPYIIPSEYIVGYIDKINKKIIYNNNFGRKNSTSRGI